MRTLWLLVLLQLIPGTVTPACKILLRVFSIIAWDSIIPFQDQPLISGIQASIDVLTSMPSQHDIGEKSDASFMGIYQKLCALACDRAALTLCHGITLLQALDWDGYMGLPSESRWLYSLGKNNKSDNMRR